MMQSKRVDVPILHDVFVETYVNGVVTVKVGSEACRLEKDTNGVYTTSDLRALSETCHRLFRDDSQQMRCRFSRFVETNVPGSKVCVPDAPPYLYLPKGFRSKALVDFFSEGAPRKRSKNS